MDRFWKNRSETEESRWKPVFEHSKAIRMAQEHPHTVWMGSDHLQDIHTVKFPADRFPKTDPEPICADRSRSMISAIVFRIISQSSIPHIIQWRHLHSLDWTELQTDRFGKHVYIFRRHIHAICTPIQSRNRREQVGLVVPTVEEIDFLCSRLVVEQSDWFEDQSIVTGSVLENRSVEVWADLRSETGFYNNTIISEASNNSNIFGIHSDVHTWAHNHIDRF